MQMSMEVISHSASLWSSHKITKARSVYEGGKKELSFCSLKWDFWIYCRNGVLAKRSLDWILWEFCSHPILKTDLSPKASHLKSEPGYGPAHGSGQSQAWMQAGVWMNWEQPWEGLGALVDKKLNTTQQCAFTDQKGNCAWAGLPQNQRGQQAEGGDSAPPLQSHEIPPAGKHSALASQCKKDAQLLEQVQRRVTKVTRGLEHFSYEEKLRELGLYSLEKGILWRDLIAHSIT